ncbi:MAG: ribonuclease III [Alphaproteobacteria bacterium]|nr:ribonuclease III [Alphaproteobacteria bacterium]
MHQELENKIGYTFNNTSLLFEAITHTSALRNGKKQSVSFGKIVPNQLIDTNYERLEFLGDRVLGLAVADMLLKHYHKEGEGEIARRHVSLVRSETLTSIALSLGFDEYIIISTNEEESGGRKTASTLADVCEAIIGAIFIDGGYEKAADFIIKNWTPKMEQDLTPPKDAKTSLQELAQGKGFGLPIYETISSDGPDHQPTFTIKVSVEKLGSGSANGPSKRAAEQLAAQNLLDKLKNE